MNDLQNQDDTPPAEVVARRRRRRLKGKGGYSLMEILIVLTIIAMLVGLAGPQLMNLRSGANAKAAGVEAKALKTGLDTMSLDIGRYPTQAEGLSLLIQSPGDGVANWRGPYISSATVPNDPWGNPYIYAPPDQNGGSEPKVMSLGHDGKPGGTGNDADISS
jgi:general secretion pathway protein G